MILIHFGDDGKIFGASNLMSSSKRSNTKKEYRKIDNYHVKRCLICVQSHTCKFKIYWLTILKDIYINVYLKNILNHLVADFYASFNYVYWLIVNIFLVYKVTK